MTRQQEVIYLPKTKIEIKKVTIANDGNPLIFAQEVKTNENIRTKETGNIGDDRPETSVHQNIDKQGTESIRNGENNSGISEEVQSRDRRDVAISQWGKSADSGNVRIENEQILNESTSQPSDSRTADSRTEDITDETEVGGRELNSTETEYKHTYDENKVSKEYI